MKHQHPSKNILPRLIMAFWAIILLIAAYFYFTHQVGIFTIIFFAKSFVLEHLFWGIVLFLLVYCIRPLFFVIAAPFDIFSGMVFGPVYGLMLSMTGTFFSSMFTYWIARNTGGRLYEVKEGKKMSKLKKKLQKDTLFTVLMMRSVMLPFDVTNYICGMFRAPFFKFLLAGMIGISPATFIIVSAGSAFYGEQVQDYETMIAHINYENLWFASCFFATILLTSVILKRRYKNLTI